MEGSHWLSTSLPKSSDMPGTMSHQTLREPNVIISAYLKPMI